MAMRVLLADDEELTLRYLEKIIDWQSLGYSVEGRARNGVQALKSLGEEDWDLLITDIRMPEMDGLKLIERVRQKDTTLKIVVLSAFSDFEYARRSFGFGISGYLLKPVDEKKLIETLDKIRDEREEEKRESLRREGRRAITRESLLKDIILERRSGEELASRMELLDHSLELDRFQLLLILIAREGAQDGRIIRRIWEDLTKESCSLLSQEPGRRILVTEQSAGSALINNFLRMLEERLEGRLFIGVSGDHKGLGELVEAYGELKILGNLNFYSRQNRYLLYKKRYRESQTPLDVDRERALLLEEVRQGGAAAGTAYIGSLLERMEDAYGPCLEALFLFIATFLTLLKNSLKTGEKSLMVPPVIREVNAEQIRSFRDLEELGAFLSELVTQMVDMPVHPLGGDSSELIRSIKEYISENYQRTFTLDELAEDVGRSKNYLCRVFKESTGDRIWEYATAFRMEQAKHLLAFSSLKIGEVARRVGYDNSGYFTRVFKSRDGLSPQAYRDTGSSF